MHKKEIANVIKMLVGLATYFHQEMPENILEIYTDTLLEKDYDEIEAAIKHFFETGSHMPLITDFNEFFIAGGLNISVIGEMRWANVIKIIKKCGSYLSWTDKDPAFRKAVDVIGYDVLCQATEQNMIWLKKDFIRLYTSLIRLSPENYESKKYFIGSNEADNLYFKDLPTSRNVHYNEDKILYLSDDNIFAHIHTAEIELFLNQNKTLKLNYYEL